MAADSGKISEPGDVLIAITGTGTAVVSTLWWLCPNEPRCGHPAVIHDIWDDEDEVPRCCAEGCDCGTRAPGTAPDVDG